MWDKLTFAARSPRAAPAVLVLLTTIASSSRAVAFEWRDRTAFGMDLGIGSVLGKYHPDTAPGGMTLFGSIRANYDVHPEWSLELVLRQWSLPGSNHATMTGLGARFEPYRNEIGRAFADGAVGLAWTKDGSNLAFDLGVGFEMELPTVVGISIGPALRYGHVIDPSPRSANDGSAWSLGVSGTFHLGRYDAAVARKRGVAAAPVRPYLFKVPDSDRDGVTDEADQCPEVAVGQHPDAFRSGCPENDEDGDGITDSDDVCPVVAAGNEPDPAKKGCPFIDTDGDGITDADDFCPEKPGPTSPDRAKNGCPLSSQRRVKRRPAAEPKPASPADLAPMTTPKRGMSRPTTAR